MNVPHPFEPYPRIAESFGCLEVPPRLMDRLWMQGWRHFGPYFFRNSLSEHEGQLFHVQPLRIHLPTFRPGKRFRQILRKNADLRVEFQTTIPTEADQALFAEHKQRFHFDAPEALSDFLGEAPWEIPCENVACRAYQGERLLAASYLDLGEQAASSIYGSFALDASGRSLGYFTMLCEMQFALERGMEWYYPGYAYHEPSFYDYKKRFQPFEWLDWRGEWRTDAPAPFATWEST